MCDELVVPVQVSGTIVALPAHPAHRPIAHTVPQAGSLWERCGQHVRAGQVARVVTPPGWYKPRFRRFAKGGSPSGSL